MACGGGNSSSTTSSSTSSSSSSTSTSTSINGVAASGAAIVGATVTATDSAGKIAKATTGVDGAFTVNISGMTAPILFKVATASPAKTYYSIVTSTELTGSVNINQLTTATLFSVFNTLATNNEKSAFTGTDAQMLALFTAHASQINADLLKFAWGVIFAKIPDSVLDQAGVDRNDYQDIRTIASFKADHTKFDKVLDVLKNSNVTINGNNIQVTLDDGGSITLNVVLNDAMQVNNFSTSYHGPLGDIANPWCGATTDSTVYTTPNIVVYGKGASDRAKKLFARYAEKNIEELKTTFNIPQNTVGFNGTLLHACVDDSLTQTGRGEGEGDASGIAMHSFEHPTIGKDDTNFDYLGYKQLIKHELVHVLQASLVGVAPQTQETGKELGTDRWYAEGLAGYLSGQSRNSYSSTDLDSFLADLVANNDIHPLDVHDYTNRPGDAAAGYYDVFAVAIGYLHDPVLEGGVGNTIDTIKQLFTQIHNGAQFSTAFQNLYSLPTTPHSVATFKTNFKTWLETYLDYFTVTGVVTGEPTINTIILVNKGYVITSRLGAEVVADGTVTATLYKINLRYVENGSYDIYFASRNNTQMKLWKSPSSVTVNNHALLPNNFSISSSWTQTTVN